MTFLVLYGKTKIRMVVKSLSEETKQIMDFLKDFRNEFVEFRDEVNTKLDNHDQLLNQLADSVKVLNSEVREIKANQIKFDEKLTNIIGRIAVQQSDLDLAHEKILINERKIAKLEKQIQT